ncbi:hypothetical protein JCM8547_006214 [Rhodosporidiobolus lusitaniae]
MSSHAEGRGVRPDGTVPEVLDILNTQSRPYSNVVRSFLSMSTRREAQSVYDRRIHAIRQAAEADAARWTREQQRQFKRRFKEEQEDIVRRCEEGEEPLEVLRSLPAPTTLLADGIRLPPPRSLAPAAVAEFSRHASFPPQAGAGFPPHSFPTPWTGSFRYTSTDPYDDDEIVDYPASSGLVPRHDSMQRSLEKGRPASRIASRTALHHGLDKERWEDQWKRELSR